MDYIHTEALNKHYEMGHTIVKALNGVDLSLPEKSLSVVMGPSGSGKSTLLHLLGGLDRPTSGEIYLDGSKLSQLDENDLAVFRRKTVGFVFQSFNLIQSFNALENVSFPMRFMNVPRKQRIEEALFYLEQVGIADRASHKPSELSGGEQQRVAIARALINDPTLILADEPTGNLDTASGYSIMEILAGLNRNGRTVLVVTHDPRMRQFASHIIYLLDGSIVKESVYEQAVQQVS
ncbi:MAG: ABC transporter ATP-binding protein [Chloroflexi bacterium]|nr:ABC transporter ATP-binding protein [Chloroflexota bacterium]